MKLVSTDFASFTPAEQIRHLEIEGYVALPGLIDPALVSRLKEELASLPMRPATYSAAPTWAAVPPQWHSRACAELIGHPPLATFVRSLLGEQVVFVSGHFVRSQPGQPPMPLRSNSEPYGSPVNAWRDSSPVMVRTLCYLDDTGLERAPLRLLPRSHISFHADANPYLRYESHPAEVTLPARAGDVIVFAARLFHGTLPNSGTETRELLEFTYRPLWARPVQPLEEWDPALVAAAPKQSQPFLLSRSASDKHPETEPIPKPLPVRPAGLARALPASTRT